jgi:histidinol-phosphatase (PHP family)
MPNPDLHIHSSVSPDCRTPLQLQIESAKKLEIPIVAITEHWDFDRWNPDNGFSINTRSQEALSKIDSDGIEVLSGAELAFHDHFKEYAQHYLSQTKLDFVLGSVHELGNLNISEIEEAKQLFENHGRKTFDIYYDSVSKLASTLLYDSLAHIDIVKRFALEGGYAFKVKEYKNAICDILELLAINDKALEINTSGLRQSPQEAFPGFLVVEWFFERNGKYITIGSDAHRPEHVGKDVDLIADRLKEMGIKNLTVFRDHKPIQVPIE